MLPGGLLFKKLQPFFITEEEKHGGESGDHDEHDKEKIKIGIVKGKENGIHAPDAGQKGERHKDYRKKREYFDHFVHFYRNQNVVGFFQRLDGFFRAFQSVFDSAVRAVQDYEIMPAIRAVEINARSAQRFKDHSLGFHDAPEIKYFHFKAGDRGHHFAFLPGEYPGFKIIDLFGCFVDLGQDIFQKNVEDRK